MYRALSDATVGKNDNTKVDCAITNSELKNSRRHLSGASLPAQARASGRLVPIIAQSSPRESFGQTDFTNISITSGN